MIGTTKRRPRSLALAGAVLLVVMILGWPAIAQERPLSAWRLNEWSTWESLPEVNPYATITELGSGEGWGNSGASIGVTARAVFEPDLSRAEISAEFVPTSRAIITSDPRLFIAPLRQRLEWKVIVTVRNPNDVAMTNVRVHNQFGKAFRATLTGQSVGDARIADADVKGLLPSSSGFTWDIGYLGPGAAAKAELTVTTNQTGGRAEFAEEGVYSLDTGFQLNYLLMGRAQVRLTDAFSVIARRDPGLFSANSPVLDVGTKPESSGEPSPIETGVPVATSGRYANVSMLATRLDWRVQKPGTYAALGTVITVTGCGKLSMQFSQFANLTQVDGGKAKIAASYRLDDDPLDNGSEHWLSAHELNDPQNWLEQIELDPANPYAVRVWTKIHVGEQQPPAKYENKGVITFIVSNM